MEKRSIEVTSREEWWTIVGVASECFEVSPTFMFKKCDWCWCDWCWDNCKVFPFLTPTKYYRYNRLTNAISTAQFNGFV